MFLPNCLWYGFMFFFLETWKIVLWPILLYMQLNLQQNDVRFNLVGQKLWEKILPAAKS